MKQNRNWKQLCKDLLARKQKRKSTGQKAASHCERCWQVPEPDHTWTWWQEAGEVAAGEPGSPGAHSIQMVPGRPPDSPVTLSWLHKEQQVFAGLLPAPLTVSGH